jgi:hypothetical protein
LILIFAVSMPSLAGRRINELRVQRRDGAPTWRDFARPARYGSAKGGENSEGHMSFFNSSSLDDLARRLADSVPESVRAFGRDLEGNFKAVLQAQLSKLDLVSRQEFDVQAAILERTQAKLAAMEARLKDLEAQFSPSAPAAGPAAGP